MNGLGPHALGGGPLAGDRIVRLVYLDESGTGKPEREPWVVVSAVIVHADKQWKSLTQYLVDMADHFVPPPKRPEFKGFHAKELYSGGKTFERDPDVFGKWWPILDHLLEVPKKFNLPITYGRIPRAQYLPGGKHHDSTVREKVPLVVGAQANAFIMATVGVEYWMNHFAAEDEIAQLIMENNEQSKSLIAAAQLLLADPQTRPMLRERAPSTIAEVSRLMLPMHFEEKSYRSALQLADACAWAVRRRLSREPNSERFIAPLRSQFVNSPTSDLEGDAPAPIDRLPVSKEQLP